ncbi:LD-carboxypeptidase [Blautia sp. OF03-13]|uniref:LD-carboxypeptidase n=1 Tax=Blautia sp. OF03-13 TaxID=2292980 RepID=UPI0011C1428B|nr:LD-carboxypeptidase [Blautia sp. OF03-13]
MSHKIGITACSNPMHPSFSADLARLCQILRKLGFDPVLSPCLFDNGSGFSGTGAERADALMNLYCDPEITDIFDVSGGDMANEVLPYLDFSVIAASGKRFWGYSDLTTIVNAVTTATGNESMLYQVRNLLYDHSAEQITLFQNAFPGSLPASSTSLAHFCRAITWKV